MSKKFVLSVKEVAKQKILRNIGLEIELYLKKMVNLEGRMTGCIQIIDDINCYFLPLVPRWFNFRFFFIKFEFSESARYFRIQPVGKTFYLPSSNLNFCQSAQMNINL